MKYFYLAILFSCVCVASSQNTPDLRFDSEVKDYGSLNYGEFAECEFEFTNTSQTDLKIKSVKSNSRSLSFKLKDSLLKPGQSSKLSVIYDTKDEGPIRKTITIFCTGDPSVYTLTIKGRVLPKP